MTTAVIEIPRELVVVADAETTAPMPVLPAVTAAEPLAPLAGGRHRLDYQRFVAPRDTVTVRQLLARDVVWSGRLGRRRTFAPWVTFVLLAVAVPLLFAVLAGCTPEPLQDRPVTPAVEVSGDSPSPTIVPGGAP